MKKSAPAIDSDQGATTALSPVMDLRTAARRRRQLVEFVQKMFREGCDYGRFAGASKDTLLKPGAEKLTAFFGLAKKFMLLDKVEDWCGADSDGEPFFYYLYRCQLRRGGRIVAEADGSCNSWEKRYRYRKADRLCPHCQSPAIIKGRDEYGGGWLCYRSKGGCGAKWPDGDVAIESQETGLTKNENPADLVNTIQKMAQKRALIAATLVAVGASEFFTQDLDEMEAASPAAPKNAPENPAPALSSSRGPSPRPAAALAPAPDARQDHQYRRFSAMFRAARTPEKLAEFWQKCQAAPLSIEVRTLLGEEHQNAERRIRLVVSRTGPDGTTTESRNISTGAPHGNGNGSS